MTDDTRDTNLRIQLFEAVDGDPAKAQAVWGIVGPELGDWRAAAHGWEERAERVTAERDEARATVERVSALLARWEDPDTMEIDIGDLRAALSPAGGYLEVTQ